MDENNKDINIPQESNNVPAPNANDNADSNVYVPKSMSKNKTIFFVSLSVLLIAISLFIYVITGDIAAITILGMPLLILTFVSMNNKRSDRPQQAFSKEQYKDVKKMMIIGLVTSTVLITGIVLLALNNAKDTDGSVDKSQSQTTVKEGETATLDAAAIIQKVDEFAAKEYPNLIKSDAEPFSITVFDADINQLLLLFPPVSLSTNYYYSRAPELKPPEEDAKQTIDEYALDLLRDNGFEMIKKYRSLSKDQLLYYNIPAYSNGSEYCSVRYGVYGLSCVDSKSYQDQKEKVRELYPIQLAHIGEDNPEKQGIYIGSLDYAFRIGSIKQVGDYEIAAGGGGNVNGDGSSSVFYRKIGQEWIYSHGAGGAIDIYLCSDFDTKIQQKLFADVECTPSYGDYTGSLERTTVSDYYK